MPTEPQSSGTPTRGAVFFSYASEDSEAVRPIVLALRAQGIEVWFDKDALRGGDAWDLTIRRQIKECTLFVPVISASTRSRLEGYFRREWNLAIERTRDMAPEKPFLVPIAIDGTNQSDPGTPEAFAHVQWTRLLADSERAAFAERVKTLLTPSSRAASERSSSSVGYAAGNPASDQSKGKSPSRAALLVCGSIALAAAALWLAVRARGPSSEDGAGTAKPPTAATAPAFHFPTNPDLVKAWNIIQGFHVDAAGKRTEVDTAISDFALAEDLTKAVLAQKPNDPEATVVYAHLNWWYFTRGFDRSEARLQLEGTYAQRALDLAPENPEALVALAQHIALRSTNPGEAAQLLHQAIKENPTEPRYYRILTRYVLKGEDMLSTTDHAVDLFPNDYLTLYDASFLYRSYGLLERSEQTLDRAIAVDPSRGAGIIQKAYLFWMMHGDSAAMKHWLDQLKGPLRLSPRYAVNLFLYAQATGDSAEALEALRALPSDMISEFLYLGPKQLLEAELLASQGKSELARLTYQTALERAEPAVKASPTELRLRIARGWILRALGRLDDAKADAAVALEGEDRPYRFHAWAFETCDLYFALGDHTTGLVLLKEALASKIYRKALLNRVRVDPVLRAWAKDPGVSAVLSAAAAAQ